MRRVHVVILLLSAAVLCVLLFLLGEFGDPGADHEPGTRIGSSHPRTTSTEEVGGLNKGNDVQREGSASSGGVHGFDPEDLRRYGKFGDNFLRDRGETSYNLLAVFAATGERNYLLRALERFPADPAVLYVAFSSPTEFEDRTPIIERFKLATPDNPIPYLFSAADLFEKKSPEAIAALKAAIERPALYNYLHERAAAFRELALYAGETADRADAAGLFAQNLPELDAAMMVSRQLRSVLEEQDPGSPDVIANARLLYEVSRMFQTPTASRTLIGYRMALEIEKRAIQAAASLPENPLPVELQSRLVKLAEMEKEAAFLAEKLNFGAVPAPLWKEFFQKIRLEGDFEALRWLVRQREVRR